jgi:PTH1 family peptidyl-tRNA hydrolase
MWVVAGLGNPGPQYAGTRHNIGFLVVEELAGRLRAAVPRRAHRAEIAGATVEGRKVLLARPQTMMNLSGESVAAILRYYKLGPDRLLLIYDDLDLPFGTIRVRPGGSAGGHNGVRSVIQSLGTLEIPRVRVGIGRPTHGNSIGYVLGRWTPQEREDLGAVVSDAAAAVEAVLSRGLQHAMNAVNSR